MPSLVMVVFVLWSLFNYTSYRSKNQFTKQQQATANSMISIFYVLFMAVLVYYISKKLLDLGIPQYLFNPLKRREEIANDGGEMELRERDRVQSVLQYLLNLPLSPLLS